jgi:hypothetical protein
MIAVGIYFDRDLICTVFERSGKLVFDPYDPSLDEIVGNIANRSGLSGNELLQELPYHLHSRLNACVLSQKPLTKMGFVLGVIQPDDEEINLQPSTLDAAEDLEPDVADLVIAQSFPKTDKIVAEWIVELADWAEKRPQSVRKRPKDVLGALPIDAFASLLSSSLILADLGGRLEVEEEDENNLRLDARRPEWLKLPFTEAITFFRDRLTIPVEDYKQLSDRYFNYGFAIAGITQGEILDSTRFLLDQALITGSGEETFIKQFVRLIGRKGWQPSGSRMRVIFDTNIRSAYGRGRETQMSVPSTLAKRPLWLIRGGDSVEPRPHHLVLNNKAIPAADPFWKVAGSPPWGFFCRHKIFAISEDFAKRRGVEVLTNPPDPKTIAEPGFRKGLLSDTSDRDQVINEALDKLPPDIKAAVKKKIAGGAQ